MEYSIVATTYEDERLRFFISQIRSCERSIVWWQRHAASRGYSQMDIQDRCSELGMRIGFLKDAVAALHEGEEMDIYNGES